MIREFVRDLIPPVALHSYRVLRHSVLFPFEPELHFVSRFLRRTHTAIDVGADVGLYTSIMVRGAGQTIAIEPNPSSARYLRRLRLPNCRIVEAAASDIVGERTLYVPADRARGSLSLINPVASEPAVAHKVRTCTLDSLDAPRPVSFIKIDVEGYELSVLHGAAGLLDRDRPALMVEVEYRHGGDVRAVFDLLGGHGYDGHVLVDGNLTRTDPQILAELQSPDRLRAKEANPRFAGYINNVIFLARGSL